MIVCLCMHCFLSLKWYKQLPVTLTFLVYIYYIFWWQTKTLKNLILKIWLNFKLCLVKNNVIFISWCSAVYPLFFFAFSAISYNSQLLKLVNEIDLSMCTLYRFHSNTQVSFKHPFFVHCGVFNSLNQFLINFLEVKIK